VISVQKRVTSGVMRWASAQTILVLVVCMFTQCVCQNSREDVPPTTTPAVTSVESPSPEAPKLPAGVDVKDLDVDEKLVLAGVLNSQFDPCGEPQSFMAALEASNPCKRASESAAFVVDLVAKGLSKRQVVRQLLKELARTTERTDFALDGSPYVGDPGAKVIIVEYMDFQCPSCRLVSQPAKDLAKKHGAAFYVKHMPLEQHELARPAAIAAMAAHRQGRFWQMSTLLFANQDLLSIERIDELAKEAGCDMKRYGADKKSPEIELIINRDFAEAERLEIEGTPTFYVDGYMIDFDQLEAKILKAKNGE
jgi:protein-disulfide isomerase